MARIPKYQQQQLASSRVGTPGVDNSFSAAANAAASTFNQIGNSIYNTALIDYRERQREEQRIRAEQRAAQKQLENMQHENNVAGVAAEVETSLNELENERRIKYQWDTSGAMDDWNKVSQDLVNEKLDAITDPRERLMAEKVLKGKLTSHTGQFSDYLTGRIPDIGRANTQKIGDALRLSVNDPTLSGNQVLEKLEEFQQDDVNSKAFYNAYGPAADAEMRKFKSDAARNFLSLVANTGDLERVTALVNDERFNSVIEGTDKESFYSRQRTIAAEEKRAIQHTEEMRQQTASIDAIIEITSASDDGTLSGAPPDVIERALNDPDLPASTKLRLAGQKGKSQIKAVKKTNDTATLKDFGGYVKRVNKLHDVVLNRWANLWDDKNNRYRLHGPELTKEFREIQKDLDNYVSEYEQLKRVAKSLQTNEAKRAAASFVLKSDRDLSQAKNYLRNDPRAKQEQAAKSNYIEQVGSASVRYSNPQQQQVYNYYYQTKLNEAWDILSEKGIKKLTPAQAKQVRQRTEAYAVKQAESKGFLGGQ